MRVERIESLDDPRVEVYHRTKDPELVKERGLFMAESQFVVQNLIEHSRFRVHSVFIGENRLDTLRETLERLPEETPVYIANRYIMDEIVGYRIHRSVLACGEVGEAPSADSVVSSLGPGRKTVLVLEAVSNHDNIGGIFRNAAGFGIDAVLLDAASADPLYRKAIRVSIASTLTVPFGRVGSTDEAFDLLERHGFQSWALTPRDDAEDIDEASRKLASDRRVALWLGAEGPGLTEKAISRAKPVQIEMGPHLDSLNVGSSSAVALYLVTRG